MEPPQIVKINGKEYALIRASDQDGKEHQFLLPSELSVDSFGRFVAVSSPLMTSPVSQPQTSGHERNMSVIPASSSSTSGTTIWSQEHSNWTPKLGTDLDSKWLQRIETDYMSLQSESRIETVSFQQAFNTAKFPIFTKADTLVSKPKPTSVLLKPVVNVQSQTVVAGPPVVKGQPGPNKNLLWLATGNPEGPDISIGAKPTGVVGSSDVYSGVANTVMVSSETSSAQKLTNLPKSVPETAAGSPVYKSKLEKAIAANNMNIANSHNIAVGGEQTQTQGTLKRLLNSGEYRPQMLTASSINESIVQGSEHITGPGKDDKAVETSKADLGTLSETVVSTFPSGAGKKKPVKGKATDQNMTTASGEYYKKIVNSEKTPPSVVSSSGNTTLFAIPTAALEKVLKTKNATGSTSTPGQPTMGPPATLVAKPKCNLTTASAADVAPYKAKLSDSGGKNEAILEMEYFEKTLAQDILEGIWELREKELFCDALLLAGDNHVKLHKIVLAGVSPQMNKKVAESREAELKLMLPSDITYDNVELFVSYLYLGRIRLTVENVQQLYRLSGVFHLDHLKKHCYDFCRLSKMGHLIISSPYQEAAKRIVEPTKSAAKRRRSQTPVKEKQGSQLAKQPAPESDKALGTSVGKKEVKTTDFDWMTPDPSQSNMPIRKRGRTRRGLTDITCTTASEVLPNTLNASEVSPNTVTATEVSPNTSSASEVSPNTSTSAGLTPSKVSSETLASENRIAAYLGTEIEVNSVKTKPAKARVSELPKKKAAAQETWKVKVADPVEEVIQQFTALPDPLATGKIDESELLKIVPTEDEMLVQPDQGHSKEKSFPAKTMVTRFRNRPKTMSVIEAAAQKKAKSNDTSSVYASKSPTKAKGKVGKQANAYNSAKSPKSSEKAKAGLFVPAGNSASHETEKQLVKNDIYSTDDNVTKHITSGVGASSDIEYRDNMVKVKEDFASKHVADKVSIKNKSADSNTAIPSSDKTIVQRFQDKNTATEMSLKRKNSDNEFEIAEAFVKTAESLEQNKEAQAEMDVQVTASPPKKAKQRKSTGEQEQESPKDTVYMRPPPKKRAKEIREMMKHEENVVEDTITVAALEQPIPAEPSVKDVSDTLENDVKNTLNEEKKVNTKKAKKKLYKDNIMLQQVYDIELSGKGIEGEKQYRCLLCNNVFIFARRVVNHLVSTHDIPLEESRENVTVEPKSACPKICDICGYQTKEMNIYYIHFHKYFRHGVPLPKGWQPFTCDLCKKEFFTKFQLREHKLIHFEDNPFVCEHCGSGFKSRTCLNSHVFHRHSSVRKYVCGECPKAFKTRTQLKVHCRIHSGDKPFGCPEDPCTYRSTTRGNMRLHLVNKHKFSNEYIKDIMNNLRLSVPPPPSQETEMQDTNWTDHSSAAERDINEERAVEMASDPATLTTLVEAAVAEVNSARGYPVQALHEPNGGPENGMGHVLPNVDNMASQLMDQDQVVNQTSRGNDINWVHPIQLVPNMNMIDHSDQEETLTGHMSMMVQAETDIHQNSDMLMRHQDQNNVALHNYHQTPGQHAMTLIPLQEYREQDHPISTQAYSISQDQRLDVSHQMPPRPRIDPGSREARMIVKEVLQGHEPRSLLKAAILQGTIDGSKLLRGTSEGAKLTLDSRSLVGTHPPQSEHQFPEESTLVIDTHPELIIAEDQVVHSVRMQEPFRGGHSNVIFRGGHDPSQHQDMDPAHMQSFQTTSMAPPPSYSGPSHGIITAIPVSDITVSHGLEQGQYQSEAVQTVPIQQSPGYGESSAQQQTSPQLNSDGTAYGYYQQNFPIENY